MSEPKSESIWRQIGPGVLVAATGVGAGDLATAAFTGSRLGTGVLWAVLVGALMKFVLNEGLARWQLATGTTFVEGAVARCGRPLRVLFLIYLVVWSYFVGRALVSACGVTAHALLPLGDSAARSAALWGAVHSVLGLILARAGGFRLFERAMSVCVGVMFLIVTATAVILAPPLGEVLRGMVPSAAPTADGASTWIVGLIGGVGGTVTILCYGYWLRERGVRGREALRAARLDLGVGYAMTAVFGLAMVVIGSTVTIEGKGASLIIDLAARLSDELGAAAGQVFLVGAWGAVFSSLLGVWQSVPYLFADVLRPGEETPVELRSSFRYRGSQLGLAVVPALALWIPALSSGGFETVQKAYAVVGAWFVPLLALALLLLASRRATLGQDANGPLSKLLMFATLAFFVLQAVV